jgi:hypothetical protein
VVFLDIAAANGNILEKQMRMMTKFFGIAVALSALTVGVHAQTAVFVGGGSSALFLELGDAAGTFTTSSPAGLGAVCVWSQKSGKATSLTVSDGAIESGQSWIAWTPGTVNKVSTCGTIGGSTQVYAYVQLDSVLGNRLYFNGGTVSYKTTSPVGAATDNLIHSANSSIVEQATLPLAIWTAVSGQALTAAGTDIRPEDAEFALTRATASTGCGVAISGSQYLGLGYTAGTSVISSYYSGSTFHTNTFSLPSSGYTVLSVGAAPIVFAVNTSGTGFGSAVTDISLANLQKYLEGQIGSTSYVTGAAGASAATVLIREPLSGTYNTVEYAVPNTIENQQSQETGNCNGLLPNTNPLHLAATDNSGGYRNRVIGTGEAVSELLAIKDALGYAFWSTGNFANVGITGSARYLTVDGYDPLYDRTAANYSTIKNTIPTASNGYLTDVTFSDLNNKNYPIWSMLRLVTGATPDTSVTNLVAAAQNFVNSTTLPDFVKATDLTVVHSHFTPPSVTVTPNNGGTCGTEAGGDVAGVILALNTCTTGERQ